MRVNSVVQTSIQQRVDILLERAVDKDMLTRKQLEAEFHKAMVGVYHAAAEHGYRPTYFLRMVSNYGGLEAAKRLINAPNAQSGLRELWQRGLLGVSLEALVLEERWKNLFIDDELQKARERLIAYGYKFD